MDIGQYNNIVYMTSISRYKDNTHIQTYLNG